jgi:hypothetical protein
MHQAIGVDKLYYSTTQAIIKLIRYDHYSTPRWTRAIGLFDARYSSMTAFKSIARRYTDDWETLIQLKVSFYLNSSTQVEIRQWRFSYHLQTTIIACLTTGLAWTLHFRAIVSWGRSSTPPDYILASYFPVSDSEAISTCFSDGPDTETELWAMQEAKNPL